MNMNKTEVVFVVDRSGSMDIIKNDVIGGFNRFLEDQQNGNGECYVTFYQFDTAMYGVSCIEKLYEGKDVRFAPKLSKETYIPRGGTPLLDAIGISIVEVGRRLAKMPENDRPGKIVFVIQTDGEENSSKEYSLERIKEMVKHQADKYSWNFVFLGANIDAIGTGSSLGTSVANSLNYRSSGLSVNKTYNYMSTKMKSVRSATTPQAVIDSLAFTEEERTDVLSDNQ